MIFLHISKAAGNSGLLDKYVNEGKCVFVLIYMDGCGPCNATRPEWAKLKHTLSGKYKDNNNVVIADVNSDALEGIKHIQNIRGFPTMRIICKRGQLKEDFEEGKHLNKARTADAFIEWIELYMKQQQQQQQQPQSQPTLKTTLMHMQAHAFQNNNPISHKRKKYRKFNNRKKSNKAKTMHKFYNRGKTRRHKKRVHGK
jgi:desulfoferrodoxin (superoxide reductase-like protein)